LIGCEHYVHGVLEGSEGIVGRSSSEKTTHTVKEGQRVPKWVGQCGARDDDKTGAFRYSVDGCTRDGALLVREYAKG
jgi:hypothetical protein